MNYKKVYDQIIEKRQKDPINEGYSEKHHILPRSLGGSDNPDNLVRLSAREHFICHYLLAKMYERETNEWYRMNHAFMMMKSESVFNSRYFNSRLYEALKGDFSSVMSFAQKGKKNSQYGTCWICNLDNQVKKIPNEDLVIWLNKGWIKGRTIPKPSILKDVRKIIRKNDTLAKREKIRKDKKEELEKQNIEMVNENVKIYSEHFIIYEKYGFKKFVEITGYEFSLENLVSQFSKYVQEFVPQSRIKRGK